VLSRSCKRHTAVFVAIVLVCLSGRVKLFSQAPPDQEVAQIVAQSQQALNQHDEQKALTLIKEGMVRFPDDGKPEDSARPHLCGAEA